MTVRVFGIRHHGPGSARALGRTLRDWDPDVILIEGPSEAESVLGLAASPDMKPPVALLGYLPGRMERSTFYPMAAWSPEWVALRHGLTRGRPVRMIDLPVAAFLGDWKPAGPVAPESKAPSGPEPGPASGAASGAASGPRRSVAVAARNDPLARLAEAAGYDDTERWWEDVVEHRLDAEPWDAIAEAMAALRAGAPADPGPAADAGAPADPGAPVGDGLFEARREAAMRQHIRAAEKAHDRVAVVCGAWHVPALVVRGPARADAALLKGLPRDKALITWVPWTNDRLAFASGYGAGVTSPGWYEHLFVSPDRPIERWMARVAALLREERMDAPPASVIDAVRLAETLAGMRGRPLAGLSECTDAARAALAGGYEAPLDLVGHRLVVGEVIGQVPPETPMVALAADLAAHQKRLRIKPEASIRTLELDLRRPIDLERSRLLHRLAILAVPWGVPDDTPRGTGTFREVWVLGWEPELAVRVVEAAVYGTTVEAAAAACAREKATKATHLAAVTETVEQCLLAELGSALPAVVNALDQRAAVTRDVAELMDAVVPLSRALRYGSVRRTDADALAIVVRGLVARITAGLVAATMGLDEDAGRDMAARMAAVSAALVSAEDPVMREAWFAALASLHASEAAAPGAAGRASRILLDAARIDSDDVGRRLSRALSPGEVPARGAAWVEGLLAGSGLLLVHDRDLLAIVDGWLAAVGGESFDAILPLLRRAFAEFAPAERRMIGQVIARQGGAAPAAARGPGADPAGGEVGPAGGEVGPARESAFGHIDHRQAQAVRPLIRAILGGGSPPTGGPPADGRDR